MKLSLCITTYNRYDMTIESFAKVIDDPRIDDIVIMDDNSTDGSCRKLADYFEDNPKVNIIQKVVNQGMSLNKRDAISHAKNEWCIIFDSDNIIGPDYLDAFFKYITPYDERDIKEDRHVIFCPDFAKPDFDYRAFSKSSPPTYGIYDKKDAARCIVDSRFNCLMNTCNYIVNRDFYLSAYQHNPEHIASDTIWHNYNHLKAGGKICVVPGMQYMHRVHDGSGFMQDAAGNMARAAEVRKLIQSL